MGLQRAKNLSPQNEVRDMSIDQIFTATTGDTKTTDYTVVVNILSDNTQEYTTGKVTLDPALPKNATIQIPIPSGSVPNGKEYKWSLETFNGTESVTTREYVFSAYTTPIVGLTAPETVTSENHTFTMTHTQDEDIEVDYYSYTLFDENDVPLSESGNIFGFSLSHEFDGLIRNTDYKVQGTIVNLQGVRVQSPLVSFTVAYDETSFEFDTEVIISKVTSISTVRWAEANTILGTTEGTVTVGDGFADIEEDSKINFSPLNIQEQFTTIHTFTIGANFNGGILDHGADYVFGYDTTTSRFFVNNDGFFIYSRVRAPQGEFTVALQQYGFYLRKSTENSFERVGAIT